MTMELRIAQSTGVQSTGSWQTAPPDDFTVAAGRTVMARGGFGSGG
jgi:hypothetical protein